MQRHLSLTFAFAPRFFLQNSCAQHHLKAGRETTCIVTIGTNRYETLLACCLVVENQYQTSQVLGLFSFGKIELRLDLYLSAITPEPMIHILPLRILSSADAAPK